MTSPPEDVEPGIDRAAARYIVFGFVALFVIAAVAFMVLRKPAVAPDPDIAGDTLLVVGFEAYRDRCVSCHGAAGRGDGPIAKGLPGPKVGDLTDAHWKHGDRPEQMLHVIAKGVPDSAMPGWENTFSPDRLRAVTAYVYHLAGRPVPAELRFP